MKRLAFAVALVIGLGVTSQAIAKVSVQDVLTTLDQRITTVEKSNSFKADQELAYGPVPEDLQGTLLATFLLRQSNAAYRIGDAAKREELLQKALAVGAASGSDMAPIFWEMGYAFANGGDIVLGAKYRSMAADALAPSLYGRNILWHSRAAATCAFIGDFACAQRHYDKASQVLNGTKGTQLYSTYRNYWIGYLTRAEAFILQYQGKNEEADKAFQKAIEAMKDTLSLAKSDSSVTGVPDMIVMLTSERATNLSSMNNSVEAETLAIQSLWETLNLPKAAPDAIIYRLRILAAVMMEQGRFKDARELTNRLLQMYAKAGYPDTSSDLTEAKARLARLAIVNGDWLEARKLFDQIQSNWSTEAIGQFRTGIDADPIVALTHLQTGDREGASKIAGKAVEKLTSQLGSKHYETALARAVLALTLPQSEAQTELQEVVPILLSPSRQSNDDVTGRASQDMIRRIVLEKYLDLASPVEGFAVAEALRARSVQSSIALSMVRSDVAPELADLIRKEQDAEKQIAALNGLLLNAVSSKDNKVADELRGKIDKLRDERGALSSRVEKQFPNYSELVHPKPVSVEEIQSLLRDDEVMISIYVGDDKTFVWAIPKAGKASFAPVALTSKQITEQVAALRSALDPNVTMVKDLPTFDVSGAYRLYEALLKPVEAGWKNAKNLTVITNGALGYFPFALFPTQQVSLTKTTELFAEYRKVPWLVNTHSISMVPSTSAFKALRTIKPSNASRSFAGFGDPNFQVVATENKPVQVAISETKPVSGDYPLLLRAVPKQGNLLPALPDTREEILSIAKVLNADVSRDVFLGSEASLSKVKNTPLTDYRVIEFATHGLTAGELGLTQPALALSGGEFLTVNDIIQLKLNADWVVLSACNTAAGGSQSTEALSGLGSAFFYSGARSLLVTNWPVQSTSAMKLTTELFRLQGEQPTLARSEALRQAMLSLRDKSSEVGAQGQLLFSYAHPLFWAPFSLVGDGSN